MSYNTNLQNKNNSLRTILDKINSLPEASSGVELPELTNPATANDLLAEKELIDGDGNIITGTFTIDDEIATQDNLIAQIQIAVDSLPEAGDGTFTLQSKSVTPTTNTQTIIADDGYDGLNTVTVNAIPSTYIRPTFTKEATIYIPATTDQTISAGTYCSGVQTIKGDSNLTAENIKSGVSIFGVSGTYESSSGSGGNSPIETCTVQIENKSPGPDAPFIVYYTDINFVPQILNNYGSFEIPKNTIISIEKWSTMVVTPEGATRLFYAMGNTAYQITNNVTFIFMG